MKTNTKFLALTFAGIVLAVLTLNILSAITADASYVTIYPGEEGPVSIKVDNNENFDIEQVSVSLTLDKIPFTSVGSSQRDLDDLNQDDDDTATFTIRPSTDIIPGDYSILYTITYVNADNNSQAFTKTGSFGIRVSAKTDLDFSSETRTTAILGQEGQVTFEIINKGLGDIKSISVQVLPQGFTLLSSDKIFVGTIKSDDSDTATFNVVYTSLNPQLSVKVSYKDFDNNDQTQTVTLPLKVYTQEQALKLGLVKKSNTGTYFIVIIILIIIWYFWRKARKNKKKKEMERR
jgi:hypothetical protein